MCLLVLIAGPEVTELKEHVWSHSPVGLPAWGLSQSYHQLRPSLGRTSSFSLLTAAWTQLFVGSQQKLLFLPMPWAWGRRHLLVASRTSREAGHISAEAAVCRTLKMTVMNGVRRRPSPACRQTWEHQAGWEVKLEPRARRLKWQLCSKSSHGVSGMFGGAYCVLDVLF